ncbi:hypothetical protein DOT_2600 [Desulfosporosinus sp. OT]|nr:hypothetical protein DOT_2600 [Desulfosporosinus sp. OT]
MIVTVAESIPKPIPKKTGKPISKRLTQLILGQPLQYL